MGKKEREWLAERSLGTFALILGGLMLFFLIIEGIMSYYGKGEPIVHPLVYAFIAMIAGLFGIVDKVLKRQRTEIMELRHKIGSLGKGGSVNSQLPSSPNKEE